MKTVDRRLNGYAPTNLLNVVPSHDESAEVSVLGSMLIEPAAAGIALDALTEDDFYLPRHRMLFAVFSAALRRHGAIDESIAAAELAAAGKLDDGLRDYLGTIQMRTPTAANVESYCRIVKDRAADRHQNH